MATHIDEAGLFLILGNQMHEHRLWLPQGPPKPGTPLQFELSADSFVPERLDALRRFWLWMTHGDRLGRRPKITERQRRLARTLVALDARRAGASYREIAELILGPARVRSEWSRITPLRDPMRTLVKNGFILMRGGYRLLLKPPKRKLLPPP